MRVDVLHNAAAGYGRAALAVRDIDLALRHAGHSPRLRPIDQPPASADDPPDALVIVGGDGTVHHALPFAIASRVPIYHYPAGTENLFARDWGMRPDPPTLLAALDRARVVESDAALCNRRPFALMCSVGFDAAIIHRRAALGHAARGHRAYLLPVLEQLADPVTPRLDIRADGREVVAGRLGLCIIANSPQYALRLNPASRADPADGLLDLVFLPVESTLDAARWSALGILGLLDRAADALSLSASTVEITSRDPNTPCQIDGDPLDIADGLAHDGASPPSTDHRRHVHLHIAIRPRALRILDARHLPEHAT